MLLMILMDRCKNACNSYLLAVVDVAFWLLSNTAILPIVNRLITLSSDVCWAPFSNSTTEGGCLYKSCGTIDDLLMSFISLKDRSENFDRESLWSSLLSRSSVSVSVSTIASVSIASKVDTHATFGFARTEVEKLIKNIRSYTVISEVTSRRLYIPFIEVVQSTWTVQMVDTSWSAKNEISPKLLLTCDCDMCDILTVSDPGSHISVLFQLPWNNPSHQKSDINNCKGVVKRLYENSVVGADFNVFLNRMIETGAELAGYRCSSDICIFMMLKF